MSEKVYRDDIEKPPWRIAQLPVERGYPVPWFVAWIDGKPEFRAADGQKFRRAILEKLCWVCGERLGSRLSFVIGPMCCINRVSAEPPCHLECAEYSVKNCPFLVKPHMIRREDNLPEEAKNPGGEMIMRNPGCICIWTTKSYKIVEDGRGGRLIRVGDHESLSWWREGRTATRAEVLESVKSGLPNLERLCYHPMALSELERQKAKAEECWPKE